MSTLSQDFIRKIAQALEQEEVDIYTLSLYSLNSNDLNYFIETDRKEVKRIFRTLIEDTKRHAELLKLIVELAAK